MTVCEQTGSENTFEHEFEREDQDTFKNKFPTLLLLLLSLSYSAFTVVSKKEKRATVRAKESPRVQEKVMDPQRVRRHLTDFATSVVHTGT